MYLKNHIKSDIIIPQHISLIGVFTSHMFLPTAVLAYQNKTYLTTAMLLGLYTSSILHWRKNKSKGSKICGRVKSREQRGGNKQNQLRRPVT